MRSQKTAQAVFLAAVASASACALVLGDNFEKGGAVAPPSSKDDVTEVARRVRDRAAFLGTKLARPT